MASFERSSDERGIDILAGTIITVLGAVGSLINITVIVLIIRSTQFHNAFGYICTSQLVADIFELLINIFWTGPSTFLSLDASITNSFIGNRIGQIAQIFRFASIYSRLLMALNRMVAIAWPMSYTKLFTGSSLVYFIGSSWMLSLLHGLLYSWDVCGLWYDAKNSSWVYKKTTCGFVGSFYMGFLHGIVACVVIFIFDTFTYCCVRRRMNEIRINCLQSEQQITILRNNIRFFVQGCVNGGVLILAVMSFHLLSKLATTKMGIIATTTFNWEIAHATDGVILIVFNKPLRKILLSKILMCLKKGVVVDSIVK